MIIIQFFFKFKLSQFRHIIEFSEAFLLDELPNVGEDFRFWVITEQTIIRVEIHCQNGFGSREFIIFFVPEICVVGPLFDENGLS